jgi:hypothetical protein
MHLHILDGDFLQRILQCKDSRTNRILIHGELRQRLAKDVKDRIFMFVMPYVILQIHTYLQLQHWDFEDVFVSLNTFDTHSFHNHQVIHDTLLLFCARLDSLLDVSQDLAYLYLMFENDRPRNLTQDLESIRMMNARLVLKEFIDVMNVFLQ